MNREKLIDGRLIGTLLIALFVVGFAAGCASKSKQAGIGSDPSISSAGVAGGELAEGEALNLDLSKRMAVVQSETVGVPDENDENVVPAGEDLVETATEEEFISEDAGDAGMSRSEILEQLQEDEVADRSEFLELRRRMAVGDSDSPSLMAGRAYSFQADGMDIRKALELFARANDLNMIIHSDVSGSVTVKFKKLPFREAMIAILDSLGYWWEENNGMIKIYAIESKTFHIDYIKLVRGGKGSSQATLQSSGESSGGSSSGDVTISQEAEMDFWLDLAEELGNVISTKGKLVINEASGTVMVTDAHKNIVAVEQYIKYVTESIQRQVLIEVRIMEVTLNDEYSLGVDWTQVMQATDTTSIQSTNTIASPFGLAGFKDPTVTMAFGVLDGNNFNAVVTALQEQGEIKVISKPKLMVMNNQPALIKVGTDTPFFEATTTPGVGGSAATVTESVQYVTVGVVLSITPQISADGMIIMDVTPIISRLAGTVISSFGSTAPILDIKQSSTVVRLRDGEMATIGGMIQHEKTETVRQVPLLGSIPLFGKLFSGSYESDTTRELVVFLTPRIISRDADEEEEE